MNTALELGPVTFDLRSLSKEHVETISEIMRHIKGASDQIVRAARKWVELPDDVRDKVIEGRSRRQPPESAVTSFPGASRTMAQITGKFCMIPRLGLAEAGVEGCLCRYPSRSERRSKHGSGRSGSGQPNLAAQS